ncbi:unnamed protein product, partial [Cuscuta campestris]
MSTSPLPKNLRGVRALGNLLLESPIPTSQIHRLLTLTRPSLHPIPFKNSLIECQRKLITLQKNKERGEEPTKNPQEVPETTIMGDCEETEARNPSPDHKAESTHETMGTEDATSMKPLQEMVESCHEVMETDAADASMKPLQAESTHETMGIEDAASMKPLQEM